MWSIFFYVYTRHLGYTATELGRWKDVQAPNGVTYRCITYATGGARKEDFEENIKNKDLYGF
jgi:hypothetical protein